MIINDLVRTVSFWIDNIDYGLIPQIYKLFIYLSNINLFDNNNALNQLVSHIYVLLGIFMLFKVSFSLLQYIVDPNSFRDSSKGMGKLVTNVLVALVLLVSVPSIFSVLMWAQEQIISSNVIGKLILGTSASDGSSYVDSNHEIDVNSVEIMARDLQFMLYGAFASIDGNVMDAALMPACSNSGGVLGTVNMATRDCLQQLESAMSEHDDANANGVTLYSFFKYIDPNDGQVVDRRNFSHYGALLTWKVDGTYVINYLGLISALAGIYVAFLLISFSIDVAVRAIKLCFLQMVAPIAIISYIDPKESISNGRLHNWIIECAKTYFSLFLRLATIFLVMFLVSMIADTLLSRGQVITGLPTDDPGYNIWIYLFLVIGAFMFAKQLPKIIESIFGITGSGDLHLNPFKNAGFAALAGGTVGLGLGAVTSGIAASKTSLDSGENKFMAARRALGGAVSGGIRGGVAGLSSGGKGFVSKSLNVAGDVARSTAMKANTKARFRYGAYVRNAIGAQSLKETMDQEIAIYEGLENTAGNMEARARDQLSKKWDAWKTVQALRAKNEHDFSEGLIDKDTYTNNLNDYWNKEQDMIADYINKNGNLGGALDGEDQDLLSQKESFTRTIRESGLYGFDDLNGAVTKDANGNNVDFRTEVKDKVKRKEDLSWKEIDKIKKAGHNQAVRVKSSNRYEDATNAEKAKLSDLRQSFLNK